MKKVNDSTIKEIKEDFKWGDVADVIVFQDIIILEYIDKHDHNIKFHPYFVHDHGTGTRDFLRSYTDAETALVNAIAFKYEGANSKAGDYFMKMIRG